MDKKYSEDEVNKISMKIILHAGDARNQIKDAMNAIKAQDFERAQKLLKLSSDNLRRAHESQTKVIQDVASGESLPFSVLFTHAQDTLMTIMSEYNITKEMIEIFKEIQYKENKNE